MSFYKRSTFCRSALVAATAFALVFSQTVPALAYGPGNAFGGYNDVRAMGYFRIPLGASQVDKDSVPSLGFTVKRQFQFNDPLYENFSGSYRNSSSIAVDVMDLRFGMNGKLRGFEVGGLSAFQAKSLLNAAENGNPGTPSWVWWTLGGAAVLAIVVVWAASLETKCHSGSPDGPEIPCGGPGFYP